VNAYTLIKALTIDCGLQRIKFVLYKLKKKYSINIVDGIVLFDMYFLKAVVKIIKILNKSIHLNVTNDKRSREKMICIYSGYNFHRTQCSVR